MVEPHARVRPSLGGPVRRVARIIRRNLPPLNFITLHYAYFFITCLVSAVIFWGASTPARSVSFTDSLFLCVSAMTLAGLNTVNLSDLNTFQQVMLFLLIMAGSAIFVSAFVVHVRKKAFEAKIHKAVDDDEDYEKTLKEHPSETFPPAGFSGLVGRNSQFHHLTEEEREALGGAEYKAIKVLSVIVPLYYVLWQLLSCIGIGAYVAMNRPDTALQNGLNPWWVGAFNAVSAFNNSGMSLLDANMTAFQTAYYMLLTMGVLILAGNTCYPIFLRLIVWSIRKLLPATERWDDLRHTLKFLLDHPRRCYTNLFPSQHTWWLLLSVITLNVIDWAAFEVLNIGNKAINDLPTAAEIIDGLFQALAVRSGGFYVVPITSVRISLQVLYVIMMYISVYPVVITMRNSNVYEERSLGIYADDPHLDALNESSNEKQSFFGFAKQRILGSHGDEGTKAYFLRQQLQAQLAHDLWWLVLAVFVIMIIEGGQFERDPANFSVFNVIFETVSGYGCVGVSTGVTYDSFSFSGSWHTLSKLVLCAVMLRGRHRGLPVAIDKAVLLPSEAQYQAEEEDAQLRMERTTSRRDIV
ncbi:Low-affinity potassium transport protein [Lasiodiplodia theobromae]|uniref:Low-affinity potassium transport protein n=1 Tax=Lasiodiplodia theobromae TaxID=45133 RepID=A0A5N5DTN7_9PEZI|nr:Low-affinity potassium transport protein [Lasiodiplodia theobromae]